MNGDYVMIGHGVAKSENYRFFVKPISLVDHWGVDHDGDFLAKLLDQGRSVVDPEDENADRLTQWIGQ